MYCDDLYKPGPYGLNSVQFTSMMARIERMATRAEAMNLLIEVLSREGTLFTGDWRILEVCQIGRPIGTGGYRSLMLVFQEREKPIMLRPGISIDELVAQII